MKMIANFKFFQFQKINFLIILVVLSVAIFLRFFMLGDIPKGLQSDEASFLFNSAAILETGKDEDGNRFPLYLESLIDSKPAIYSYLQVPFIATLGPTVAASRLPSAIIGTISIVLFFFLVQELTNNTRLSLFAASILAISPWHIMNSRATQEVIVSTSLIMLSLLLAHQLIAEKKSVSRIVLFFLSCLAAMYFYHSAKIILILYFPSLLMIDYLQNFVIKRHQKFLTYRSKILLLLSSLCLLAFLVTGHSAMTRFTAIGLLNNDLPKAIIHQYTVLSTPITPLAVIRLLYNKPLMYGYYIVETYLSHFNLNYLFTVGGATKRFIVPNHGLFYFIELPMIFTGFLVLISRKIKYFFPTLFFLLIAPLPAALTTEEIPSSIRAFNMLLPLIIFGAYGLEYIISKLQKQTHYLIKYLGFFSLVGIYVLSLGYFSQQFFVLMPEINTQFRSRSYEIVTKMISDKESNFQEIHFTSDLREMYIYLWKNGLLSITEVQAQPKSRFQPSYQIGKYHFEQQSCHFSNYNSNTLYVAPYTCEERLGKKLTIVDRANFDDGQPGFLLLTTRK